MTKDELAMAISRLTDNEQLEIMREIIYRFWPDLKGKPVGFYDVSKVWDDWDDKELDKYYGQKWDELRSE